MQALSKASQVLGAGAQWANDATDTDGIFMAQLLYVVHHSFIQLIITADTSVPSPWQGLKMLG